jgi:hypothetical protein
VVFEKEYIMWCLSAEWIARKACWRLDDVFVVSAGKLRKLWDFLNELRSCVCVCVCVRARARVCVCVCVWKTTGKAVLRHALLPAKTAQFTQFFRQIWRHTVKSLRLTESVWGAYDRFSGGTEWCELVLSRVYAGEVDPAFLLINGKLWFHLSAHMISQNNRFSLLIYTVPLHDFKVGV